jgi:hypothetical protein
VPNPQLRYPEDIRKRLLRAWARNHSLWLAGGGKWPFALTLGQLTQTEARLKLDAISNWVRAWRDNNGAGQVEWQERHWFDLGRQHLPVRLVLKSPDEIAVWAGEDRRWNLARARYHRLLERWQALATSLSKHFDVLADYSEQDFERLMNMLAWLNEHPHSNLFPRQLPVAGLDSKWLDARRRLITELVGALRQIDIAGRDFYECCGLRALPNLVRMKILDAALRARVGGIRDLAAPSDDLLRLNLPARCLFVVENLQTGLAFDDLEDAVVVMGLGYGVDTLRKLPFAQLAAVFYWGDVDTHGFAILSRARGCFPHLQSLMMDEATLLRHRDFCLEEQTKHGAESLPNLTAEELAVYRDLKQQKWGYCVRLEQEHISWPEAWCMIKKAHGFLRTKQGLIC